MINLNEVISNTITKIQSPDTTKIGYITRIVGSTIEARGLNCPIGTLCKIETLNSNEIECEIIGFKDETVYLIPFSKIDGIKPGALVKANNINSLVGLGDCLLGRVVDGIGTPLDGKSNLDFQFFQPIDGNKINPLDRTPIDEIFDVGIRSINSLLTIGKGQRVGLIAGSGVGKSSLMAMMTKFSIADVVVIGLIGERGREINEFIKNTLGEDDLKKSVLVVAPSDDFAAKRLKAAKYVHLIAEYFRDKGKNVLLLLDSMTRVAHAQRELGLSIGEPPTSKGYPPSVYSLIPSLIERSGNGPKNSGTITSIYTILAESDNQNDPIVDLCRASLDGHFVLSRELSESSIYPAIDIKFSISRLMNDLLDANLLKLSMRARKLWSVYRDNEDMIKIGAYQKGSSKEIDDSIKFRENFISFLSQNFDETSNFEESFKRLQSIVI